MKTFLCVMIIIIFSLSEKALSQETVKGFLRFKPIVNQGADSVTASVIIPLPSTGVPDQVKAVLTKKISGGNQNNEQRYLFMKRGERLKTGTIFILQDGNIIADPGKADLQKEDLSIFLVYRGVSKDGKAGIKQLKVDLESGDQ